MSKLVNYEPLLEKDIFKQTLMHKVMSMKLISNKIKNAIVTNHSFMNENNNIQHKIENSNKEI